MKARVWDTCLKLDYFTYGLVRSERSCTLWCTPMMVLFFINPVRGFGVELISCVYESCTYAGEKHRKRWRIMRHGTSPSQRCFSSGLVDDLESRLILSALEPWKRFMKNVTIVDMHKRFQLRSDPTNTDIYDFV